MDNRQQESRSFLAEVYRRSNGSQTSQISMYETGAALGLDRTAAGQLAEELIVMGLLELRTLAGGISITAEGLATLGHRPSGTSGAATEPTLGTDPVASQADQELVRQLLAVVKECFGHGRLPYDRLEELVIDLKTVEVQLLSPRPKTAVLRELLRSLQLALGELDPLLAARLARQLGGNDHAITRRTS
jgi:hypothetical protein